MPRPILQFNVGKLRYSLAQISQRFQKYIPTVLTTWWSGLLNDVKGPYAYRALAVVVAGYVGLYSIVEARHDRQVSLAAVERSNFITLVTSGKLIAFVTAMKDFGTVQAMDAYVEPNLYRPLDWWKKENPNVWLLLQWARNRLKTCTYWECGGSKEYKIDLASANFQNAILIDVDLSKSDLFLADLRGAVLLESNFEQADLRGASLIDANLQGANLQDIRIGEPFRNGQLYDIFPRRRVTGTDVKNADLRNVQGLDCNDLRRMDNWQMTCRNSKLRCGHDIPKQICK